jgi:glycosyltransferase involved in cell wall biosynthesis
VAAVHSQGVNLHLELAAMSGSRDLVERWRHETELPEDAVTVLPTLSDAELQTVYARVDVHCMPSTGEGFGIPVIEAAMMRIPNVLSPIDVFHELIGEDAVFARSLDAEDIAKALLQCICSDTTDMVQRGAAHASRYQFDSIHLSYAKPAFGLLEAMLHSNAKKGSPSYAG